MSRGCWFPQARVENLFDVFGAMIDCVGFRCDPKFGVVSVA
jgi:hypothetical protein